LRYRKDVGAAIEGIRKNFHLPLLPDSNDFPAPNFRNQQLRSTVMSADLGKEAASELRKFRRLLETSRLLNSTLELQELTEIVLRILYDELPIERCTLFILDRRQKSLRSVMAQELGQFEIVAPLGQGLAGTAAITGEPIDVEDVYADPRFDSTFDRRSGFRTRDALSVPIFNREQSLVGVLQVLNRLRQFTATEREFLTDICTYIGIALHNAWMYHELKQKKTSDQELRSIRDRLARAEKQSAVRELVASVIHEIRNPLTLGLGHCGLLREENQLSPSMESRLEKIELSITKAETVAQNFLKVARRKETAETTDVNRLIQQTVDLMAYDFRQRGVSIVLDLEIVPMLDTDSDDLQQVLLNLLKNALDAASEQEDSARVSVRSSYDNNSGMVRVEISDNGHGIPTDIQPKIFQPFFTTKAGQKGTGLGLAVSKRIVEQHDGNLSFNSVAGDGTTFSIEVPLSTRRLIETCGWQK
jgi:signal transduction histidine kinase